MKKELKRLISLPIFKNVMKTKYPTQMGKLPLPQMPLAGMESALTRVSTQKKPETSIHPRQKKTEAEGKMTCLRGLLKKTSNDTIYKKGKKVNSILSL